MSLLLNGFVWISLFYFVVAFNDEYPNYTVCSYHEPYLTGLSLTNSLHFLKIHYSNCTHISGNLIIFNLHRENDGQDPDLSFLSTIQEIDGFLLIMKTTVRRIPLTNLRVIRGNNPFSPYIHMTAAIYMSQNFEKYKGSEKVKEALEEVDMRNLKVIEKNDVHIDSSEMPVCGFPYSVNWEELFDDDKTQKTILKRIEGKQAQNCTQYCSDKCPVIDGRKTCWGSEPEKCQAFTKCRRRVCSRCYMYKGNEECCNDECIGGCFGQGSTKCEVCRNVRNGNACVQSCPALRIFDDRSHQRLENPNKKYRLSSLCMSKCPDRYLIEESYCVKHCSLQNYFPNGSQCSPCTDGHCSKHCKVLHIFGESQPKNYSLHSQNLPRFENCTFYSGPIVIDNDSFNGKHRITNISSLNYLKSLKRISGSIYINLKKFPSLKNLSFLENLETLNYFEYKGAPTSTISITNTKISYLGWKRLKRVTGFLIVFFNNTNLCYVDTINWYKLVQPVSTPKISFHNKMGRKDCGADTGHVCHSECEPGSGCWGPGSDFCFRCTDLRAGDKCVQMCNDIPGFYHAGEVTFKEKQCKACHPQCRNLCSGPLASQCYSDCKNAQEDDECVAQCSRSTYRGKASGICKPCSSKCHTRQYTKLPICTGPSSRPGPNGCNKCVRVVIDNEENLIECLDAGSPCPKGMFSHFVSASTSDNRAIAEATEELAGYLDTCRLCDSRCELCRAPHNRRPGCLVCRHFWYKESCVEVCPKDYIYGVVNTTTASGVAQRMCLTCHPECYGCTGPSQNECIGCRRLKVYSDLEKSEFVCQSDCPADRPVEQQDDTGSYVCLSEYESIAGINRRRRNYVVSGVVVGLAVVVLLCLIILVWFMRKRAETKRAKEELRVAYSNIKEPDSMNHNLFSCEPNLGRLEMINADDLEFDDHAPPLGTGAFGAVYRGRWNVPSHARLKGGSGAARVLDVAIKVIIDTSSTKADIDELLEEAKIMASVSHKHCLRLIGVCLSHHRRCLVSAYVAGGSMDRFLQQHGSELSSLTLLSWPQQIANGMTYLEARGIIHRDLATRNVLVTSPDLVQITDFGLAKMLEQEGEQELIVRSGRVPIRWLALETLERGIYSHKTDVWSYGVTLWEIFTLGKRPYDTVETAGIKDFVLKGSRLPQPDICTLDVYMVMVKCWMEDPFGRPSFVDLMKVFRTFSENPGRYLFIRGDRYALDRPHSNSSGFDDPLLPPYSPPAGNGRPSSTTKGPSVPPRSASSVLSTSSGSGVCGSRGVQLPRRYQESPSRPPQPSPRSPTSFDRLSGATNTSARPESRPLLATPEVDCITPPAAYRDSDSSRYCADPTESGLPVVLEDYLEPEDPEDLPLPPPPPPPSAAQYTNNAPVNSNINFRGDYVNFPEEDKRARRRQSPPQPGEYLEPAAVGQSLPKNTTV